LPWIQEGNFLRNPLLQKGWCEAVACSSLFHQHRGEMVKLWAKTHRLNVQQKVRGLCVNTGWPQPWLLGGSIWESTLRQKGGYLP